jgi:hypothetical protein
VLVPLALHYLLKLLPPHILGGFAVQGGIRTR